LERPKSGVKNFSKVGVRNFGKVGVKVGYFTSDSATLTLTPKPNQ